MCKILACQVQQPQNAETLKLRNVGTNFQGKSTDTKCFYIFKYLYGMETALGFLFNPLINLGNFPSFSLIPHREKTWTKYKTGKLKSITPGKYQ